MVRKIKLFKLDYSAKAKEGFHYKIMVFFMMRTLDYLDCGMMDSNTFLYAEEIILSERLKKINKGVYFYPDISVIHHNGGRTKKSLGIKVINKYILESEIYYYRNYINTPSVYIQFGKLMYLMIVKMKSIFNL